MGDIVKLFVERRVMWNDLKECHATAPGCWDIGRGLKGSFVIHLCDRAHDHAGDHFNSEFMVSWPADTSAGVMV